VKKAGFTPAYSIMQIGIYLALFALSANLRFLNKRTSELRAGKVYKGLCKNRSSNISEGQGQKGAIRERLVLLYRNLHPHART